MSVPCFWCAFEGGRREMSQDHLIPRWARAVIPEDRRANLALLIVEVRSCIKCNTAKGPMPPAVYARLRADGPKLRQSRGHWSDVARVAAKGLDDMPEIGRVRFMAKIISAMSEDFPRNGNLRALEPGQPWREASPLRSARR